MTMHRPTLIAVCMFSASLVGQGSVWAKRSAVPSPPAPGTIYTTLAFDTARGVALYTVQSGATVATHEWGGTAWTSRGTTLLGSARYFRCVYDVARNVCVGVSWDGGTLTTYEWNNASSFWVQRNVALPIQRDGFALAYDVIRSRTVLFGGQDPNYVQAETYEFDGTTWMLRSTGGPVPRKLASMTYDSARQRVLLFGGESVSGQPKFFADTWEWNGTYWLEAFGATGPSARRMAGLAYDQKLARTVLIGGSSAPVGTWEWDSSTWKADTTSVQPVGHDGPALTFDPVRGRLLFAGMRWNNGWISECWERFQLPNTQPLWTAFGAGCPGNAGIPTLAAAPGQLPRIGQSFTAQLSNVPPGPLRLPFGFVGASKTNWSGIPLPFDCGAIGMPGCTIYCSADITVALTASSGLANWPITIPYDVGLIGALAYQQALVLDPAVNLMGVTTSNAGEMRLGL